MWKPFSKFSQSRQRFLLPSEFQEFNRRRNDLLFHEKILKKLQNDAKNLSSSLEVLFRNEMRLLQNLGTCNIHNESFTSLLDAWNKAKAEEERINREYIQAFNAIVGETCKHYCQTYSLAHNGLKKWEHLFQQCIKEYEKIEKMREKEKTTANATKLEQQIKIAESSKQEFDILHRKISTDAIQLMNNRSDYFSPSLEALVHLQIQYNAKLQKLYSGLCSQINADVFGGSEKVYHENMQQKLIELKSLSIVAE